MGQLRRIDGAYRFDFFQVLKKTKTKNKLFHPTFDNDCLLFFLEIWNQVRPTSTHSLTYFFEFRHSLKLFFFFFVTWRIWKGILFYRLSSFFCSIGLIVFFFFLSFFTVIRSRLHTDEARGIFVVLLVQSDVLDRVTNIMSEQVFPPSCRCSALAPRINLPPPLHHQNIEWNWVGGTVTNVCLFFLSSFFVCVGDGTSGTSLIFMNGSIIQQCLTSFLSSLLALV